MTCGCTHEKELHNHGTDGCEVEGCGCCEFITDLKEWEEKKALWYSEAVQDTRFWDEVGTQEDAERADNDESSGWTDLGNRGGTTFCY